MNRSPSQLTFPPETNGETEAGLSVIRSLVQAFNEAEIPYCHWKSNEHLTASMLGLTDLDVLVDRGHHHEVQQALAACGFRSFRATAFAGYPAVEDHLALDEATGRMVHLHLHYRLTLGQKYLKGYRLPWEAEMLATRRRAEQYDIDVISPEAELLLLLVRDALKRRLRSRIAAGIGLRSKKDDFGREFAWLVERADRAAVLSLGLRLIGPGVEDCLTRLIDKGGRQEDRQFFARKVRPALKKYRTYGSVTAAILAATREIVWILGGLSRKRFRWAFPLRRVTPRGGIVVAFLGSDGSGKSSLSADAIFWLGGKLDVVPIYFGSGDGPGSLLRLPMQFARRLLQRGGVGGSGDSGNREGWRGTLRNIALVPWALSLSLEKHGKHKKMVRARNRGLVVICDRYPQDQVKGFNDGLLLSHLSGSRSRMLKSFAAWEAKPYREAHRQAPDIVIKLLASPQVALSRRPEMSIDEIDRRIRAVRAMRFPPTTSVVEIDADRPLDEVVRTVRSLIWQAV